MPSGNTTLYAKWEKEKYRLTFAVNGGNEIGDVFVVVGESADLPVPEKDGFRFEGWFANQNFFGAKATSPYTPNGNTTLYAKWGTPKYVITFAVGAAAAIDDIEVEIGDSVTLPVPSADGYEFGGWFLNETFEGNALGSSYTPSADVTLYAKWTLVETAEQYFVFTPDSTGKFASVAASTAEPYPETIVIPATYQGLPVKEVARGGFTGKTTLRSVILPEGITTVNSFAFSNCTALASITLPKSLTRIAGLAFYGCAKLGSVYYNGEIADWCGVEFGNDYSCPLQKPGNLYIRNSLVTEATIPSSVTELKKYAFFNVNCITKVSLPSGLTKIDDNAFYRCRSLREVNLPDSIVEIGLLAFEGTQVKTTENGVQYVGKWAVGYDASAIGATVTLKDGTAGIASFAFQNCTKITEVTISGSVKTIGGSAFKGCTKITRVTVEQGVESFGYDAFDNDSAIKDFYYTGSISDWFQIKLNNGGKSTPLFYAQTFYIQNEPIVDLIIPSDVTEINRMAFQGYRGIKSAVIPKSVAIANAQIFLYCENLTDIWCEIAAKPSAWHSNWRGDHGVTATVHWGGDWEYVDGKPTLKTA